MQRIKRLFVKGEDEVEIPPGVETSALEEPRVRRLKQAPRLITSYEDVRTIVGMRVPALKLYSADPYCTMEARMAGREGPLIQLLPGVSYPVVWEPAEQWRPPMMSESEKQIDFQIPLGRTFAVSGMTKRVETEAWAIVHLSAMPYGWNRLGIVGRQQFNIDVVSADFDTRTQLVTEQLGMERLLRATREAALMEFVESARHLPEGQRIFAYDEMLKGLGLGGVNELRGAKDPDAVLTKKIEDLTRERDAIRRSKR